MKHAFKNRNFIPWNRNSYILKRHLPLVLKPLLLALVVSAVWKFALHDHGIHFAKHHESPLLFLVMPLVGFVYVLFASIAVESVFKEYKMVSKAIVKKDVETFLLHRDEQLPILMHLLVGAPTCVLITLTLLFRYEDMWIGVASVFSVVFVVFMTWVVATELDNYENSVWFRERIPKEWLEIDVDSYFKHKG